MENPTKPKVIIFGTGKAGLNALKHFRSENCEVVAFCDNNQQKQGSCIEGIPVIGPQQLTSFSYQKLVIASMYLNEIRSQLINEVGIPEHLIEALPTYVCLEQSSPERELQRQTLSEVAEMFDQEGAYYYLDSSALLSIVRSGDFLPWPHGGVDFSICHPYSTGQDILDIIARHYPPERFLVQTLNYDFIAWSKGDIRGIEVFDDRKKTLFTASIRYLHQDHVYWLFEPFIARVPAHYITRRDHLTFAEKVIPVPGKTEQYLALVYGDDWRTPRKDWHWADSKHIFKEISLLEAQGKSAG